MILGDTYLYILCRYHYAILCDEEGREGKNKYLSKTKVRDSVLEKSALSGTTVCEGMKFQACAANRKNERRSTSPPKGTFVFNNMVLSTKMYKRSFHIFFYIVHISAFVINIKEN